MNSITFSAPGSDPVTVTAADLQDRLPIFDLDEISWTEDGISLERTGEPRQIVKRLIAECHGHLAMCRILVVWRRDAKKRKERRILAFVTKTQPYVRLLANAHAHAAAELHGESSAHVPVDPQIILDIALEQWLEASDAEKLALIDHELCHIVLKNGDFQLEDHDIQEFSAVVGRRGAYRDDLRRLAETFKSGGPLFRLKAAE